MNTSDYNNTITIKLDQCYTSLYKTDSDSEYLQFSNMSVSQEDTHYIANATVESGGAISHDDLALTNNDIFNNWRDIWTRVPETNNNYPVLLFFHGTWDSDGSIYEDKDYGSDIAEEYEIYSVQDLVWVADQVNIYGNTFKNDTLRLKTDIDLYGYLWNPIGWNDTNSFQGTFYFEDHVIRNLGSNGYYKGETKFENLQPNYSGLFGYTKDATFIGDLTLVYSKVTDGEGSYAAVQRCRLYH